MAAQPELNKKHKIKYYISTFHLGIMITIIFDIDLNICTFQYAKKQ